MEILKNNWRWKLIAFILGFFLWSYIAAGVNPTQSVTISDIAITVDNPEILDRQNLEIVSCNPPAISASVTGKRNSLGLLEKGDVKAVIDGSKLHEGKQTARIKYDLPTSLYINDDSPKEVEVLIEKIVQRNIEVQVSGQGTLQKDYVLESLTPTPKTVTVTGPRSKVDTINHLEANYEVSSLTADSSANVPIIPVDKSGNEVDEVKLSLSSVNIAASVYKIKSVPITVAEQGENVDGKKISSITIVPNSVQIKGKTNVINQIPHIETQPLDRSLIKSSGLVHKGLVFPDGITPVEDLPEVTMEITVAEETDGSIDLPYTQIKLEGLPEKAQLKPSIKDGKMTLRLAGFSDDFLKMKKSDFTVKASFKGIAIPAVGKELEIPVQVKVPEIFKLKSFTPEKVKFKVVAR